MRDVGGTWMSRAARIGRSAPVIGLGLAVATWDVRPASLRPSDVIDYDYRGALEWAAVHRVAFGSHLAFTFGPLGFLASPAVFFAVPATLGLCSLTALKAGVGGVIYRYFRAGTSAVVAVILAYLVLALISPGVAIEMLVPLGLAAAAGLATTDQARHLALACFGAGALVAVAGLIKVSLGPPLLLIFLLAIVGRPQREARALRAYVTGIAVTFLTLWLVTGNSLLAIPQWVRLSLSFITSYAGMASETPGRLYSYWLAAAATLAVLVLAGRRGWRAGGWVGGALWVAMAAVALEVVFKESFVRHDQHDVLFLAATAVLLVAVAERPTPGAWRLPPTLVLVAAALETVVVGSAPLLLARPQTAVHLWVTDARAEVVAGDRRAVEAAGRAGLQGIYRLPPSWLAELRGQRVAAAPRGQPMAWTYPQLRWAPLPTIQEYAAVSTTLDDLDASWWRSPASPPWVLQQSFGLDGRDPAWDSPAAELAMRCEYAVVSTDSPFLTLLHKVPDRCGPARAVASITARLGATVTVPPAPPGGALVASILPGSSVLGGVAGVLFKGATYTVVVNGTTSYRYVAGTGASPHLLTWPLDPGTSMAVPAIHTFRVVSNDPWASAGVVHIHFSEIAVRG